ncbi:uncharacterized protein LOC110268668 [Arachis ipaensis]|uniref:uncharacterized protein LOC110268668 n=1 Tax=Arachis ipaensis TaxID=130454 RepID=UPI000A2B71AC|nr:uncharacterized protein LOC110268668 [Arachis ipaensis]QHO22604.1 uncharacterized protein DS421_12g356690 [Arachis hypogaea]
MRPLSPRLRRRPVAVAEAMMSSLRQQEEASFHGGNRKKKKERKEERTGGIGEGKEEGGVPALVNSAVAVAAPYRSLLRRSNRGERKLVLRKGRVAELAPSRQHGCAATDEERCVGGREGPRWRKRESTREGVGATFRRRAVRSHHCASSLAVVILGASPYHRRWG